MIQAGLVAMGVVTADTATDDKKVSYCPATVTLSQKDMLFDGQRIPLGPGMESLRERQGEKCYDSTPSSE
jgi:hypothetical protein